MSVENLTYAEEYYFIHDTLYRRTLKQRLFSLGIPLMRPSLYESNIFSGMNMYSRVMGDLGRYRHKVR